MCLSTWKKSSFFDLLSFLQPYMFFTHHVSRFSAVNFCSSLVSLITFEPLSLVMAATFHCSLKYLTTWTKAFIIASPVCSPVRCLNPRVRSCSSQFSSIKCAVTARKQLLKGLVHPSRVNATFNTDTRAVFDLVLMCLERTSHLQRKRHNVKQGTVS